MKMKLEKLEFCLNINDSIKFNPNAIKKPSVPAPHDLAYLNPLDISSGKVSLFCKVNNLIRDIIFIS